jgi:hypothetical protein
LGKHFLYGHLTLGILLGAGLAGQAVAGKVTDSHGNIGYDTAEECDAAVRAGTAKFYRSVTKQPPLLREGEASVKSMTLADITIPKDVVTTKLYGDSAYARGACDVGSPHSNGRDGVSLPLQGKFVPFSPTMPINVYMDKAGNPVRVSMKQCDNWFGAHFPRPISRGEPLQCPAEGVTHTPAAKK